MFGELHNAGRVGIWSKADSVTELEEFLFRSAGS